MTCFKDVPKEKLREKASMKVAVILSTILTRKVCFVQYVASELLKKETVLSSLRSHAEDLTKDRDHIPGMKGLKKKLLALGLLVSMSLFLF